MKSLIAILTISLLVFGIQAIHINLQKESIDIKAHSHSHHKQHRLGNLKENASPLPLADEENKALTDTQYSVKVLFGQTVVNQVIDTTSYATFVFSKNPTTEAEVLHAPEGSTIYDCKGKDCTVVLNGPTLTGVSHGGRVSQKFYQGKETLTHYGGQDIKGLYIGLAYDIERGTDNLLPKTGTLGLAYGSDFQTYTKQRNAQVVDPAITESPKLSELQNFVGQLKRQNGKLVPESRFALKVEDQLSILSIGEIQHYFASGPYTQFKNIGLQNWALSLTSFKIGDEPYDLTKPGQKKFDAVVAPPAADTVVATPKEQDSTKLPLAIFDSSSKFFRVSRDAQLDILQDLNQLGKDCSLENEEIIKCLNVKVDQFLPLKFQFNNVETVTFEVPANAYVVQSGKDVYINILSQGEDYNNIHVAPRGQKVILLGQIFLSTHYVVFDQTKNSIDIAKSYKVAPGPLGIAKKARKIFIVLGTLLLLASLGVLLAVLKQIDSKDIKVVEPVQQQAVQVQSLSQVRQPQYFYPAQQQQFVQPQFVQSQPGYVVGSPVLTGSRIVSGGPSVYRR